MFGDIYDKYDPLRESLTDCLSINHNWFNATNVNWVWQHLQNQLVAVEASTEDVRDTPGWREQCQICLRALAGIDFFEYALLLKYILFTRWPGNDKPPSSNFQSLAEEDASEADQLSSLNNKIDHELIQLFRREPDHLKLIREKPKCWMELIPEVVTDCRQELPTWPRVAYDFPSYLRADCEVCIQFAGMHWVVKHKFEGSSWLTSTLPPKAMNERWVTLGTVKKVEIRVNITKIWFKFPVFTACCYPLKTKRFVRQPDFTMPDHFSDVQLLPQDPNNRRLFAHRQVLAMNSPWFAERFRSASALNTGDIGPIISIPFDYDTVLNFLRFIYPNGNLEITAENVEGLLDMAKEYQMPNVIRKCEKWMYKFMEGGSAVLCYYLARKHELPQVQDAALLHLAELNSSQLRARLNLDMKGKSPDTHETHTSQSGYTD
ncbi:BTB/POZ domain protein, partial [Opisthorchis viverrini]